MIGVAGAGKTTLSRFVAWINNMSVFQIKVHKNYSAKEFDQDLRNVLRRSGNFFCCIYLLDPKISDFLKRKKLKHHKSLTSILGGSKFLDLNISAFKFAKA